MNKSLEKFIKGEALSDEERASLSSDFNSALNEKDTRIKELEAEVKKLQIEKNQANDIILGLGFSTFKKDNLSNDNKEKRPKTEIVSILGSIK